MGGSCGAYSLKGVHEVWEDRPIEAGEPGKVVRGADLPHELA